MLAFPRPCSQRNLLGLNQKLSWLAALSAAAAAAVAAAWLHLCSQRNLLGLNQKLSALVELGQSDSLFRLQWVDPWIRGDPNRTSMTLSMMNTR
jgi:outer membrane protein assembly factor BamA